MPNRVMGLASRGKDACERSTTVSRLGNASDTVESVEGEGAGMPWFLIASSAPECGCEFPRALLGRFYYYSSPHAQIGQILPADGPVREPHTRTPAAIAKRSIKWLPE